MNPILILGGGGHAKVVLDALREQGAVVLGFVDLDPSKTALLGYSRLGNEEAVLTYRSEEIDLANGLGFVGSTELRRTKYDWFKSIGYQFRQVIHPSVILAKSVLLGEGVQLMAGAVIQPGTQIGANTIVNTRASVDHDCCIGAHVHIAPGVNLSGNVTIGDGTFIGVGASVIQGICIGSGSTVGAGSVVTRDVLDNITVMGVPAIEKGAGNR